MRLCPCGFARKRSPLPRLGARRLAPRAEPGAHEPFKLADTPARAGQMDRCRRLGGRRSSGRIRHLPDELPGFSQDQAAAAMTRPIAGRFGTLCRRAAAVRPSREAGRRARFFEENFRPVRIARLGEPHGFLTGYYEPIVEGSRFPNPEFHVPLYRRPPILLPRRPKPGADAFPNKGALIGRAERQERDRSLSRSRRHRGRRARRPEARNLLAQGSVRGVLRSRSRARRA